MKFRCASFRPCCSCGTTREGLERESSTRWAKFASSFALAFALDRARPMQSSHGARQTSLNVTAWASGFPRAGKQQSWSLDLVGDSHAKSRFRASSSLPSYSTAPCRPCPSSSPRSARTVDARSVSSFPPRPQAQLTSLSAWRKKWEVRPSTTPSLSPLTAPTNRRTGPQ